MWYLYTVEFYSAIRNNDSWFEGKWMHLEDIMLSEESQAQKDKGYMFSVICGRQIQKTNMYTKANMIIYKLRCIHLYKNKHTNSDVEHDCNSGTALWNSGKKKKRMTEHQ
jgi:hypothetical protein